MDRRKTKSLADQRRLREEGEAALIAALREIGPLSRLELSKRANLGRTTVFKIVRDLTDRSVLVESSIADAPKGRGRPTTVFSLNPASALVAGIEVARRHVRVLLVNAAHQDIAYGVEPLPAPGSALALDIVRKMLPRLAREHGSSLDQIKQIGLGVSGIVDPLVPNATIQKLQRGIEEAFHVPVRVANNSHLASLAEATWGAARDHDDVLYVHWSSGIGSGWVSHRTVLHGSHGMAGELGHVSIEPETGPACYCGGRGCLEMLAGLEALGRRAAALPSGRRFADESDLLAAAKAHDAAATDIFHDAALQVGRVVAMATALFDPSIVVLGGEVAILEDIVIEPIRTCLARTVTPNFPRTVEVRPSKLGELAAVRGAIALVLPEVQFPTS